LFRVKFLWKSTMTSTTAEVPSNIDGVTPQWLAAVLDAPTVTDVRVEQIALDTGFSSRLYRAHLSGEGVPNSVIVKLPAESEAGEAMKMLGGYAREVAFYRHVAGRAPMGTPRMCMQPASSRTPPTSSWCWRTCATGPTLIISRAYRWTVPAAA
jgi:hypothetical protein